MHRNMFGDPHFANFDELIEALDEKTMSGSNAFASIQEPAEDNVGTIWEGWTAEVYDNEDSELMVSSVGFETEEDLRKTLNAAGIDDTDIEVVS